MSRSPPPGGTIPVSSCSAPALEGTILRPSLSISPGLRPGRTCSTLEWTNLHPFPSASPRFRLGRSITQRAIRPGRDSPRTSGSGKARWPEVAVSSCSSGRCRRGGYTGATVEPQSSPRRTIAVALIRPLMRRPSLGLRSPHALFVDRGLQLYGGQGESLPNGLTETDGSNVSVLFPLRSATPPTQWQSCVG